MEHTKVAVIGAGPSGLYVASILEERHIPYLLLEAEEKTGGQPLSLYPEKEMLDVPLYPNMIAKDLVGKMLTKVDPKKIRLNTKVTALTSDSKGVALATDKGEVTAEEAIIATGLGFHKPRPMGIEHEEECSNILYSLLDPSSLKGQQVAIFGGGDSALDWARALSCISAVTLIHRRTEFRGNADSIKGCYMKILLPYIPSKIHMENGKCASIDVENVNDHTIINIPTDTVLVNYGQIPAPSTFGYPLTTKGFGLVHKEHYEIAPHIYACGDCLFDESKKKRIVPAMEEADDIIAHLFN